MKWDVAVTALGGIVAALIGVLVGGAITVRYTERHWVKDTQLNACAQVLKNYAEIYNGLALSRRGEKPDLDWSQWNQALSVLCLIAPKEVAEAALAIDRSMWRADWDMRGGAVGQPDWIRQRRPIEEKHKDFINLVRRSIVPGIVDLDKVVGRPEESDPMWKNSERSS